jgi:hypothetical protein
MGRPTRNDRRHFEILVLSGAQAGLNWSLVLKKRDGYRRAFDKFDPEKVARYSVLCESFGICQFVLDLLANPTDSLKRNEMGGSSVSAKGNRGAERTMSLSW